MTEIHYMISDVSRILDIPAHVLRNLEYHLSLNIKRTKSGNRLYLQEDIKLLRAVKVLRDKGFHLKIIKSILPYIDQVIEFEDSKLLDLRDRMEAALGLSGIEAKEKLKAEYEKPADIDMEEGDFVIKDSSTKQRTRLSTVNTISKPSIDLEEASIKGIGNVKRESINQDSTILKEEDKPSPIHEFKDKSKNDRMKVEKIKVEKIKPDKIKVEKVKIEKAKIEEIKAEEIKKEPIKVEEKDKEIRLTSGKEKSNDKKAAKVSKMSNSKQIATSSPSDKKEVISPSKQQIQENLSLEEVTVAKIEVIKNGSKTSRIIGTSKNSLIPKKQIETEETIQGIDYLKEDNKKQEAEELVMQQKQMLEPKQDSSLLKASQEKVIQFREIMCSIVMDALNQNNHTLTNDINDVVTQSVVKEIDCMMKIREERQEERFRQLDRSIRETQLQRQQVAATKEEKKKRTSKFFRKNKVRI